MNEPMATAPKSAAAIKAAIFQRNLSSGSSAVPPRSSPLTVKRVA